MISPEKFKSILDLLEVFKDEQDCIDYIEKRRWKDGIVTSPFDPESRIYICKSKKKHIKDKEGNITETYYEPRYQCVNSRKYFNPQTGTLFEGTKIPLRKWFISLYLVLTEKHGISSIRLSEYIDVQQRTAWFILHRIRTCLNIPHKEKMDGIIESDETFFGGSNKNRHKDKKHKYGKGRRFIDKSTVLGLYERGSGNIRLFQMSSPSEKETIPIILKNVEQNSVVCTDEWKSYSKLTARGFRHAIVRHNQGQYRNGSATTNSIEGVWNILKRSYRGTHIQLSKKHIQKYCHEWAYRFNTISLSTSERFNKFFVNFDVRLTYYDLIDNHERET